MRSHLPSRQLRIYNLTVTSLLCNGTTDHNNCTQLRLSVSSTRSVIYIFYVRLSSRMRLSFSCTFPFGCNVHTSRYGMTPQCVAWERFTSSACTGRSCKRIISTRDDQHELVSHRAARSSTLQHGNHFDHILQETRLNGDLRMIQNSHTTQ